MTTTLHYTRRPLWLRLQRFAMVAWYRFEISSAEQWVAACERDKITEGEQLDYQRRAIGPLRVRLAEWEAR